MFEILHSGEKTVALVGRLDASNEDKASAVLDRLEESTTLDFSELRYLASAGLGTLLRTQKRLMASGHGLKIVHMNPHIREIFEMAGFHQIFEIE